MISRTLPWHVRRPTSPKEWGVGGLPDPTLIGYQVVDTYGAFVCVCWGEDHGREEAVAICVAVNRAGERVCHNCGKEARCFGSYEDELHPAYACDDCCAHGNEDGHCERLDGVPPCVTCDSPEHVDCGQQ